MDAGEIFFLCCVKFLTTLCCLRGLPVMTMRPNCCLKLQFYRGRWCFCNHLVNCYKSVLVIFCKKNENKMHLTETPSTQGWGIWTCFDMASKWTNHVCVISQACMVSGTLSCDKNSSPQARLGSAGSTSRSTSRSTSDVMWTRCLLFVSTLFAPIAIGKIQGHTQSTEWLYIFTSTV